MSALAEVISLLAGGARVVLDCDGRPALRLQAPEVAGPIWDALCRDGWIESMPNGGTFKLSDAGLLAYLAATDELGDGQLIPPADTETMSHDTYTGGNFNGVVEGEKS